MTTRERILEKSLELFNDHGVPNITLRRIAAELGMSQGNLNYHFKKREDIIEALYYQLLVDFEREKARLDTEEINLNFILDSTRAGMESLFRYRFLMIDFNQNMRENPGIHAHFIELEKVRKMTYLHSFNLAIEKGIMRPPDFPGEYEGLNDRIRVFSDFWIASSEVYNESKTSATVDHYHQLLVEFFYPYFTDDAKRSYRDLRTSGH